MFACVFFCCFLLPLKALPAGQWVLPFLHPYREGVRGEGAGRGGDETYKLLTGIYEPIVSDCKHNNSLPVPACLLAEGETAAVRTNLSKEFGVEGGGGGENEAAK